MALKRTLEKAEYSTLDTGLKASYKELDGKYVLDVDDSPLVTALDAERQAKKALEAKLAGYGDLTPEQVKALNEAKSKAEREKDFAAGNYDKIVAEMNAKHAKDMELRDAGEARLRASLQRALITAEAVRELQAQGGNPDLLLPIIEGRSKLQTVGEQEVAVIIGDKGGPRLKAGAKGAEDYMPMSEFVAELKSDKRYAGAFASPVGSGTAGARPGVAQTMRAQAPKADLAAKGERVMQALRDGATVISE